jgi:hypothetical protein
VPLADGAHSARVIRSERALEDEAVLRAASQCRQSP